mmetsp:Transcript_3294/g.6712  ORF Transcript_3294/g.6712 Transcript_3294/m.6712 type:complete len:97 (-) Transcript_3294:393-683(-)
MGRAIKKKQPKMNEPQPKKNEVVSPDAQRTHPANTPGRATSSPHRKENHRSLSARKGFEYEDMCRQVCENIQLNSPPHAHDSLSTDESESENASKE